MGVVYRATQANLQREIALKIVRADLGGPALLRRFEYEADVLAKLRHPGIAQIHDAGSLDIRGQSRPFLAMELVEGRPLDEFAQGLPPRKKLELLVQLCEAVEHAHQCGVIHRDLKPANVVVTPDGVPKVLDFGLARATDADLLVTSLQTQVGELLGTVPYMSPEQVGGDPADIDIRTDVYSLGVIAHELFAGRLPYDLPRDSFLDALQVIREVEPSTLGGVHRALRGDVETIVLKALEKDKERRYTSAGELAADLRRHLNEEPIVARPASTFYQLTKFARRNRALVGGTLATFVALVIGLAFSINFAVQADRARATAEHESERADEERRIAELARAQADEQRAAAEQARTLADEQREAAETARTQADEQRAEAVLARSQAEEERLAAELAAQRLDQVARFQADMLENLDLTEMGTYLSAELRRRVETAAIDDRARAQRYAMLDELLDVAGSRDLVAQLVARGILHPAAEKVRAQFSDQPRTAHRLHFVLTNVFMDLGMFEEAEEELGKARAMIPPEGKISRYYCEMTLAMIEQATQRNAEAEARLRVSLAIAEKEWGNDAQETLSVVSALVSVLAKQGKTGEGLALGERLLPLLRAHYGEDHQETVGLMLSMGMMHGDLGRFGQAEEFLRKVIAIRARDEWNRHDSNALDALGYVLSKEGRLEEAEAQFLERIENDRLHFGREHPSTLNGMNNIAFLYLRMGETESALAVLDQAVRACENLGPDAPMKAILHHTHGEVLLGAGDLGGAVKRLAEAIELYVAAGQTHHLGLARAQLASVHARTGEPDRALGLLGEAVEAGFGDAAFLTSEPFRTLFGNPRFDELVQRLRR